MPTMRARVKHCLLDVKDADGKAVTFALTEKTALRRGETSISRGVGRWSYLLAAAIMAPITTTTSTTA
jgi:hypothetical protein